ncbi:D-glucosaminate-specific PTS system IIA component [Sporomusaceae bacterium BoRhaA]|uniref:PTS sugar transporter subunit IIA n=1 Tax=Pelorhabdus rhamnosifermentans TaxID=2772457 RepID=UPI001C0644E7|nr:PTS fructose transporter subunit IIA [Pelorhabdus rhamnosifermentans]MBU2702734.1 D-glucosaminate-specific PTS system IIA component [Pelorhabdus rhamnosifermentans]
MRNEKAEILLLTHGGWGEKLIESAKMILGNTERVSEIPLLAQDTLDEYRGKVRSKVAAMADHSLLITDLFGGTTSNVAAQLSQDFNIHVAAGLNAPMLIEAIMSLDKLDNPETLAEVISAGQLGCKDVIATIQAGRENTQ